MYKATIRVALPLLLLMHCINSQSQSFPLTQSHSFSTGLQTFSPSYYIDPPGGTIGGYYYDKIPTYVRPSSRNFLSEVDISLHATQSITATSACGRRGSFYPGPCGEQTVTSTTRAYASFLNDKSGPESYLAHSDLYGKVIASTPVVLRSNADGIKSSILVDSTTSGIFVPTNQNDGLLFNKSFSGSSPSLYLPVSTFIPSGFSRDPQLWITEGTGKIEGSITYKSGTLNVDWFKLGGDSATRSPDTLIGNLTALNSDGDYILVSQAAKSMGYDHFNWIQRIVYSDVVSSGTVLDYANNTVTVPTWDPPFGGWRYQANGGPVGVPVQDSFPFYYDEIFDGKIPGYPEYQSFFSDEYLSARTGNPGYGRGFVFLDTPKSSIPDRRTSFVTALVGVKNDCRTALECDFDILPDFIYRWESASTATSTGVISEVLKDVSADFLSGNVKPFNVEKIGVDDFFEIGEISVADIERLGGSVFSTSPTPMYIDEPSLVSLVVLGFSFLRLSRRHQKIQLCEA